MIEAERYVRITVALLRKQNGKNYFATGRRKVNDNGKAVVKCACGETFETGSTKKDLHVEICSKCHPFFTGKQKLVDTGGRVERFKKKYGIVEEGD